MECLDCQTIEGLVELKIMIYSFIILLCFVIGCVLGKFLAEL
jgi:hypothetical protein